MDISKVKRSPELVQATLMETSDDQLVTKSGCVILIPQNYASKDLVNVAEEILTVGIWAMFIDDVNYSVSMATSMMTLGDGEITSVEIAGEMFYHVKYGPGDVVIKNINLLKSKKLVNNIMDYFTDYGKSPWFINYLDMGEMLSDCGYFNNLSLAKTQAVLDVLVASIARSPDDVRKYYRHTLTHERELFVRPRFIPQRDIGLGTTSNLARINGSNLARGIKAALLDQDGRPEPLEDLYIK